MSDKDESEAETKLGQDLGEANGMATVAATTTESEPR